MNFYTISKYILESIFQIMKKINNFSNICIPILINI